MTKGYKDNGKERQEHEEKGNRVMRYRANENKGIQVMKYRKRLKKGEELEDWKEGNQGKML